MLVTVIYLIVTIFPTGLGHRPTTQFIRSPSVEACKATARRINTAPNANPRIVGVDARCVVIPPKVGI